MVSKKFVAVMLSVGVAVTSLATCNAMAADTSSSTTSSSSSTSDTRLMGKVTAISGSTITLALYSQPTGTPPAAPSGSGSTTASTGSSTTDTTTSGSSGTSTATPPSGSEKGGSGGSMTLSGETKTITVSDSTTITTDSQGKSTSAALSSITVGCNLSVTMSGTTVKSISIMPDKSKDTTGTSGKTTSSSSGSATATPCSSTVTVDGTSVSFQAYNIGGSNYFKLRDIAKALDGSDKQFAITYDSATSALTIATGTAYTAVGGELSGKASTSSAKATASSAAVYLNSTKLSITPYNIGGSNYFKLRDIASAVDFGVSYDSTSGTIAISTSTAYSS